MNEHGCSLRTVTLLANFSPATSSYSSEGSEETMLHEISSVLSGQEKAERQAWDPKCGNQLDRRKVIDMKGIRNNA